MEQSKAAGGYLVPQQALAPCLSSAGTEIKTPKWRGQGQKQPQEAQQGGSKCAKECANSPGQSSRCPAGARAPACPSSSSPGTAALPRNRGHRRSSPAATSICPRSSLGLEEQFSSVKQPGKPESLGGIWGADKAYLEQGLRQGDDSLPQKCRQLIYRPRGVPSEGCFPFFSRKRKQGECLLAC